MTTFPPNTKFKYPWRKYQKRVLSELDTHLQDNHLHIIAPPGSGKTVLGLETVLRLNQATLILAPTLAVRNQWIDRFCELFLQTTVIPAWISRDIRKPNFLTVATYQGLHMACSGLTEDLEEDTSDDDAIDLTNLSVIANLLIEQGIKTIVVDEAHHLKNQWWETLTQLKERLQPVIVGLTATPPYDVTVKEWQRYLALNGPVDAEISVPELVIEGDLCPHQDLVYFSLPTQEESKDINAYKDKIEGLFQAIKSDEQLLAVIRNHPAWLKPDENLDWIYSNIEVYSAFIIFLTENKIKIPSAHLDIIDEDKPIIPPLDYAWTEVLLNYYLLDDKKQFTAYKSHRDQLESKLRRAGTIAHKRVNLTTNQNIDKLLASGINKLNSVKDIVDYEYQALKSDLRLVVLTDYIRKEFYVKSSENRTELDKIGALPIFEKIRRACQPEIKIGLLTGSLVLLPKTCLSIFIEKTKVSGLNNVSYSEVPFDNNFISISLTAKLKNHIVRIVTELFTAGQIEVLIGTKALLGEGWDAPCINSLILASFVGSFVSSNQMRGRSIRIEKGNPSKTANIWHLACLDPSVGTGGNDIEMLRRRFKNFVGVSLEEAGGIENGLSRMSLPDAFNRGELAESLNSNAKKQAGDRNDLSQQWQTALQKGVRLTEEIRIPFGEPREYSRVQSLYFNKTIAYASSSLIAGVIGFGTEAIQMLYNAADNIESYQELKNTLTILGGTGFLVFGRQTLKTIKLSIKHRDIAKDVWNISQALLQTLVDEKIVQTNPIDLDIISYKDKQGAIYCYLDGGSTFEKSVFINALTEIVKPVENPRYIIVRKNKFWGLYKQKDFHAVPEIFGINKKAALRFIENWQNKVGSCELIFTRTPKGRKLLLQSRVQSLAAGLKNRPERVNKWV